VVSLKSAGSACDKFAEVEISLEQEATVKIDVIDSFGRTVGSIPPGKYGPGRHTKQVNVTTLPDGFYVCRITAESRIETQKLLVFHK
jgi:hypothetical protein